MTNDVDMEVIREISNGAGQYEQLRGEYLDAHKEIERLQNDNQKLQRTITSLQDELKKAHNTRKACQGD